MKKTKKIRLLAITGLAVVLIAGVAFGILYGTQPSTKSTQPEVSEPDAAIPTPGETARARIVLGPDGITVSGSGVNVSGNTATIRQGGTYFISGTLENGQIYVDADSSETVILSLNGVDITNPSEAAIYIENAGHTSLLLTDGTVNRLQSGTAVDIRTVEDSADQDGSGAAVYARDDLSITGTGSLQVFGYINNGIHTTNNLVIDGGNIEVEALNNGIKGKDSVTITDGTFSVTSGGDGIKSDDTTGEGYGKITITDGTFAIESGSDAVQAETVMEISGGDFTVVSGEGSGSVTHPFESGWGNSDSDWDMSDESAPSTKGFKSGFELLVSGGTFFVDSYDDAFHSDGNITISGGTFTVSTGDDGVHAETELTIADGNIQISKSYEGLEANQILIQGGDIGIVSSDDGFNAYGGQNSWGWGGPANTTEEVPNLRFTGGTVSVNADGDGLDSNGNISVEGGTVSIDGSARSMNGAIDSGSENGGTCAISGGTVIAVGSSGMAETFDDSSTQCSFRHNFDSYFAAGSEITITDAGGNVLYSHTAAKEASSVVFSCPELVQGETYFLNAGGQTAEITLDSVSTTSGQRPRWSW